MHVGHSIETSYEIKQNGTTYGLQTTEEECDLGLKVTNSLKWTNQCHTAAQKANGVLGWIRRHFHGLDKRGFLVLYKGYFRPHLEYAIQLWSPNYIKDIECLEKIQKRATKLVAELKRLPYE